MAWVRIKYQNQPRQHAATSNPLVGGQDSFGPSRLTGTTSNPPKMAKIVMTLLLSKLDSVSSLEESKLSPWQLWLPDTAPCQKESSSP